MKLEEFLVAHPRTIEAWIPLDQFIQRAAQGLNCTGDQIFESVQEMVGHGFFVFAWDPSKRLMGLKPTAMGRAACKRSPEKLAEN